MPDTIPQDPLQIPVEERDEEMSAFDDQAANAMTAVIVSQAEGHAFVMEALRLGHQEGKMGMREGVTHRIMAESGAGQSRSQQASGQGGTPT